MHSRYLLLIISIEGWLKSRMGLFLQTQQSDGFKNISLINNLSSTKYFLKVMAVPQQSSNQQFWGSNFISSYHDPSGKFQVLSTLSNNNCQFSKSCNTFTHIGFGELDNFIEDLGVFLSGNNQYDRKMNTIIPNTQVKLYLSQKQWISWEPLIFINNANNTMVIILIWTASIIVVLSVMIICLH